MKILVPTFSAFRPIVGMKLLSCLVLGLMMIRAEAQFTSEKIIHLEAHKGFQNYEHFKRLVLISPDAPIEFLQGFDFDWGFNYELLVLETRLEYPLSDGTQYEYKFLKLLSKNKAADSSKFRLFLDANLYYNQSDEEALDENNNFEKINDTTYTYFNEVQILIGKEMLPRFKQILSGTSTSAATFRFSGENQIRLVSW